MDERCGGRKGKMEGEREEWKLTDKRGNDEGRCVVTG